MKIKISTDDFQKAISTVEEQKNNTVNFVALDGFCIAWVSREYAGMEFLVIVPRKILGEEDMIEGFSGHLILPLTVHFYPTH